MKKIFLMFVALVVALSANLCSAAINHYGPASITDLKDYIGNWYNTDGDLILTLSSDYRINGFRIVSVGYVGDTVAFYKVQITNGSSYENVYLQTFGSYAGNHEMLILNEQVALRKTKEPYYFESVDGIYLGMDQDQVVARCGQPSSVESDHRYTTWKYDNLGLDLNFEWNVVSGITIYPYSNKRFDRSGLSANSSQADFERKYNTSMSRRGNFDIGHGELIRMNRIRWGNNGVYLGFLTAGYVF